MENTNPLMTQEEKLTIGIIASALFLGLTVILILNLFTLIGAGHRGVIVTVGKVQDEVLGEGFHFVNPISNIVEMNVQSQRWETTASAASKDLQSVSTQIVVNGRLNSTEVNKLYQSIGTDYEQKIIAPSIQEVVKAATSQFTAEELITKRQDVGIIMQTLLAEKLSKNYINVDSVSIINFDFSPEFNQAIEAKVTAEQDALAAKNKLDQVKYEAEQRVSQAEGEAKAIKIQAEAIQSNGGDSYVMLQWINRWNGVLPSTMLGEDTSMLLNPLQ